MKKTVWLSLMVMSALVPTASALFEPTQLPGGYMEQWAGKSSFAVNTGSGILQGHVEFAVYDTQTEGNQDFLVPGDRRYLYAYQVFNTGFNTTAALEYFGIKELNPEAIASVTDIDTYDLGGGVDATAYFFNVSKTKAVFEFAGGIFGIGDRSVFLVLGSDFAPIVGSYEVIAPTNDEGDLPAPGKNPDGNIPEPATMALLLGGAIMMSLRKRK